VPDLAAPPRWPGVTEPEPMEPWRKALTALIKRHGQPQVVRALGVDTSTVSRWKSGERWPDPGMVLRICEALEVTPDQLYGVRPMEPRPTRRELDAVVEQLLGVIAVLQPEPQPSDGQPDAEKRFRTMERAGRKARMRQRSPR